MSPRASQNGAHSGPGAPWEGEISLGNFSGGPPGDGNEFFPAPERFGSVLPASRESSWSPLGAQEGPGGLRERIWHPNWCQNGAPRAHFWGSFRLFGNAGVQYFWFLLSSIVAFVILAVSPMGPLFWTPWGSILVTFALGSLRPRVYVAAWRLLGDVSLLSFRPVLSARSPVPPESTLQAPVGSSALARRNARSD